MSVPIILDKSSFQGLNYQDIIELHRYYKINNTPLMIAEILGDLSKKEKQGRKNPKEQVLHLAKKLFPYNSCVNMDYRQVLDISLQETNFKTDNRPLLLASKSIVGEGRQGMTLAETSEEKAIQRWKEGKFSTIDELISSLWRQETTKEDSIERFNEKFYHLSSIKVENRTASKEEQLEELKSKYRERVNIEMEEEESLTIMLDYFGIDSELKKVVIARYQEGKIFELELFSPYLYYCYTVVSMNYIGMNNGIFGNKATNLLDLQYLFYLPFTKVFSSNDKFLISLFGITRPEEVEFISLSSLKEDLSKFQKLNSEDNWADTPPDKDTETFKIWDKYYDLELTEKLKPTARDKERAMQDFEKILKLAESGEAGKIEDEPDFFVKESYMSVNDPCPCGSGKPLGKCHYKGNK